MIDKNTEKIVEDIKRTQLIDDAVKKGVSKYNWYTGYWDKEPTPIEEIIDNIAKEHKYG